MHACRQAGSTHAHESGSPAAGSLRSHNGSSYIDMWFVLSKQFDETRRGFFSLVPFERSAAWHGFWLSPQERPAPPWRSSWNWNLSRALPGGAWSMLGTPVGRSHRLICLFLLRGCGWAGCTVHWGSSWALNLGSFRSLQESFQAVGWCHIVVVENRADAP